MTISKYSLESKLASFDLRYQDLRKDVLDCLLETLPPRGVRMRFVDDAGNDVVEVSPDTVSTDDDQYPTSEMTLRDMLVVLEILAASMISSREEALAYISSVLEARGDEYGLCDPDQEDHEIIAELPAELAFQPRGLSQKVMPYVLVFRPDTGPLRRIPAAEVIGMDRSDLLIPVYVNIEDFPDAALFALCAHVKELEG